MGAEALVRWAHPTRGALAPDAFIPVAERTGLIVPLGRWVMRTAFAQLAEWIAEHGDAAPGVLNVNVSARDLREPGFADGVAALLGEHGLAADRIVLEITETMALEPGQSIVNLHRLRALGVRVSLDDFGTGHSTLTLLHDCPIDEIKLDRSFTQAQVDGRATGRGGGHPPGPGARAARGRRGRGDGRAGGAAAVAGLHRGPGLLLRPADAAGQVQRAAARPDIADAGPGVADDGLSRPVFPAHPGLRADRRVTVAA